MIQGLYAAASGLMANEERQAVIANNIANVTTPGFKRQNAVQEGFYGVLLDKMQTPFHLNAKTNPGGGIGVSETYSDMSNGILTTTGDALNVGLSGPGFLTVATPAGDRYTRNGRLSVDADGQLSTIDGYKVLGAGGTPIAVSGGSLEFDENGTVLVDGAPAGRLAVVEFASPGRLSREGNSLYAAPDDMTPNPAENTGVVQKALEMANVQMPYEMAQMMVGLRAYAANQKVINCADETMSRLIEQVAMPI